MNCEKIKEKVSIRIVLESFNLFPVKENTQTAFYFALDRVEVVPSFAVDFVKNKGFDFGTGKSYDVISIVQQKKKCSVSEALKYLSKFNLCDPEKDFINENTKKNYQILKVNDIKHLALIQYLKFRKVFEQSHLVKEIHYELNEKNYFGIGFYNNSGGVEIRNKYSKICLGKKDITLIKNSNHQNNEICIFEGFFDYLTLRNIEKSENLTSDYLILNSTAMLFKADEILKNYERISLFLDNDPNGEITKKIIQQKYQNVEDCSLLYRGFKDLNEWFCAV
ncbi:MAG: toprim domain-containing protein [Flavobacteriales bacterium]|nr:toprim domain-containing protein [Flavobacteriales bacterium]